ncbi:MAG: YkvA family protein, partial [Pseudomonadota bacterium]
SMLKMLKDEAWALPQTERNRVLNALVYFADPDDLIPDEIPGIGLLDDAIMIELVFRQLSHELEAYDDFCSFRDALDANEPKISMRLKTRRKALLERIRRRKKKDNSTKNISSWL